MRFLILALLALAPLAASAQDTPFVVDEIVAIVGNEHVLRSEVDALVASQMQRNPNFEYTDQAWQEALKALVDEKVLLTHAQRDTTIMVTPQQVEGTVEARLNQLIQQAGGAAQLEAAYGASLERIRSDFRRQSREQIMIEQLTGRKLRAVQITPSEVREWFSQFDPDSLPRVPATVQVAHIVRMPEIDPAAKAEARQIITAIEDSIKAGVPFEGLANRYSDDPGSNTTGGRYENFPLDQLVPEFGIVANQLRPGEISQVFESQFGFHIMRLNSRIGDIVDFNHVLIRIDDTQVDPADAIEILTMVRDSLVNHGAAFEVMAKRYSEEPESASRGGLVAVTDPSSGQLLRDLPLAQLGPLWQAALEPLKVGEISQPTEVQLLTAEQKRAYHIVKLLKRVPEHRVDFNTDYDRIRSFALQEKRTRIQREWLDELRERVYVNVLTDTPSTSLRTAINANS